MLLILLSLGILVPAGPIQGDRTRQDLALGVVVEGVAKDSEAERAGIQPGDVLLSWSRPPAPPANPSAAEGRIESPFDLTNVEIEQVPRGPVILAGRRGPAEMSWRLPPVPFGLTVRPVLPDAALARYEEGRRLVESKEPQAGAARWRSAAEAAKQDGQPLIALWLRARIAKALADAQAWAEADAVYDEAVREAEGDARPAVAAPLLRAWVELLYRRSEWARVEDHCRRAVTLDEKLGVESLAMAKNLTGLGSALWQRGDLAGGAEHLQRGLAIRERLAPGSFAVAESWNNVGIIARKRGDLAAAEDHYRRALAIQEKLVPGSLALAMSLNNLGAVAHKRMDLAAAEDYFRRSLAIHERLAPGSPDVAMSLNNLGAVAYDREDLAAAEGYIQGAVAIDLKWAPESLDVAMRLHNLGGVARARGDLAAAQDYLRRALAMTARVAPGSDSVWLSLHELGAVALARGDLRAAEDYLRQSHAIQEKAAPDSLNLAMTLNKLGTVAQGLGDLRASERDYQSALAIRETLAPGTVYEAESLHDLGLLHRQQGRLEAGSDLLLRALHALESQKAKLGGTEEVRVGFMARYGRYYHDSLETLIELGRPAEALHVLERARARSLLALLAERDLLFTADLPPELSRERRLADTEYDRLQARIARLHPTKDEEEIQASRHRLREQRRKQEEIAARVRAASPRLAALQYPEPLSLAGIRDTLDPGTVLLAYSVGADKTLLFVVQPATVPGSGLSVLSLPVGEKALREKTETFLDLVQRPSRATRRALDKLGSELHDLLIRPAHADLAASERLLISADGPLHSLPFGALVRTGARAPRRAPSYLIEWKPLHMIASATVYAQIKKSRREPSSPPGQLVAFGDPRYPASSADRADRLGDPGVRSLTRSFRFGPLPYTRREVEGITRLFPDQAQKYLGEEATEERARSVGRDTRYLHFACHGTLDERFPLNSALALTIPERPAEGQANGLLQAWEVFDHVRVDADLVTLSACKTGLGKEMGGEGLLGLMRAFHYAGARSVVGTLWAIYDESTTRLMERFYGHLKAGRSRDEALQAAQMDLIGTRSPAKGPADLSHPFYWAAFELSGDWR